MRVFDAVIEEILASKGNVESGKKLEIMCDKLDALIATAKEASHFFTPARDVLICGLRKQAHTL